MKLVTTNQLNYLRDILRDEGADVDLDDDSSTLAYLQEVFPSILLTQANHIEELDADEVSRLITKLTGE